MSQPELARAAGIKQPTVSNIESDRNKGSGHVAQLAAALKCSAHWLATGKGNKEVGAALEPGPEQLSAREQIVLHLFSGLFSHQQRGLIDEMHALFQANQITRRELGQKPLRGVSDAQIEGSFGQAPKSGGKPPKRKSLPRREPGTAMDDFLEPE